MQKPLQLKTVVARPVRACGLRPTFTPKLQQQPRLQSLFAGECWLRPFGNTPACSVSGKAFAVTQLAYPVGVRLPAQVDKQSLLSRSHT